MIVYCALNKINGKRYIGITKKELSLRIAQHIHDGKTYFQKALRKYGIQSFEISVIDSSDTWDALCEKEKYWITFFGCMVPSGYNLTPGGEGVTGNKFWVSRKHSEQSKAKMRASRLKYKHSPETIAKAAAARVGLKRSDEAKKNMSAAQKGHAQKPHSPEAIEKIRAASAGRKQSAEAIEKRVSKRRGMKLSPEWRLNLSLAHKGQIPAMKGRKHSEESKRKMSESHKLQRAAARFAAMGPVN